MRNYTGKTVYLGMDVHKKPYAVTAICDGQIIKKDTLKAKPVVLISYCKKYFVVAAVRDREASPATTERFSGRDQPKAQYENKSPKNNLIYSFHKELFSFLSRRKRTIQNPFIEKFPVTFFFTHVNNQKLQAMTAEIGWVLLERNGS